VTRTGRAGTYVRQLTGYRAFIPKALPPDPPIAYDASLMALLSEADQALARLDAATEFLPNPGLFVTMYVRKEAVLSSQIEGTQASLVDVLQHEAGARRHPDDIAEVVNYTRAMRHGLERLEALPLSLRLLREIHAELLGGVRGSEREPGEFRRSQNWIGPPGCTLASATFVPPPPEEATKALGDLETFLHDRSPMPLLVKTALIHAQFETIHPFLDGNGRLGRLLITFLLCANGALRRPVLYLSDAFKARRQEYYARLQAVRDDGDFEGWLRFFLAGVRDVSRAGTETARGVLALRERHRALVTEKLRNPSAGLVLLERLLEQPVVTVPQVATIIRRTYPVASQLVGDLERLGLLREMTGSARNRLFEYAPYVALFGELRP
jgi:Fic family protein